MILIGESTEEVPIQGEHFIQENKKLIQMNLELEAELLKAKEKASQLDEMMSKLEALQVENSKLKIEKLIQRNLELEAELLIAKEKASQLDEIMSKLEALQVENSKLKIEIAQEKKDLYSRCLENSEAMVYYTRLSPAAFEAIYQSLLPESYTDGSHSPAPCSPPLFAAIC